jgi:hypothetical protein
VSLATPELKVIQTGASAGPGAQFTLFASQRALADEAEADKGGKRATRVSEARK